MPRPVLYGRRVRVYVTPEHLALINREIALRGVTASDVMRAALSTFFAAQEPEEAS